MSPYPPPGLIDLPWYVVMSAPLVAEEMSREAWIDELARKWGLVREEAPCRAGLNASG